MTPDLTVRAVADVLVLSPYTVRQYAKAGEIGGAYRLPGGTWRFKSAAFNAWRDGLVAELDPHRIEPRSGRSKAAQSRKPA